mmetsp:Transcript_32240/g.100114  ORF Transcript_32240/g.100114 Transcript_32240/m.100114 type:complete len:245 (-) Transcript_32240:276-1010(-)
MAQREEQTRGKRWPHVCNSGWYGQVHARAPPSPMQTCSRALCEEPVVPPQSSSGPTAAALSSAANKEEGTSSVTERSMTAPARLAQRPGTLGGPVVLQRLTIAANRKPSAHFLRSPSPRQELLALRRSPLVPDGLTLALHGVHKRGCIQVAVLAPLATLNGCSVGARIRTQSLLIHVSNELKRASGLRTLAVSPYGCNIRNHISLESIASHSGKELSNVFPPLASLARANCSIECNQVRQDHTP